MSTSVSKKDRGRRGREGKQLGEAGARGSKGKGVRGGRERRAGNRKGKELRRIRGAGLPGVGDGEPKEVSPRLNKGLAVQTVVSKKMRPRRWSLASGKEEEGLRKGQSFIGRRNPGGSERKVGRKGVGRRVEGESIVTWRRADPRTRQKKGRAVKKVLKRRRRGESRAGGKEKERASRRLARKRKRRERGHRREDLRKKEV
jgi:hypothetical protein